MYPSSFSTWAIDTFTFEEGTPTTVFPTIWALRMRVSISAMGSVMLMRSILLPARLDQPGNLAAKRDLAQLVSREAELAKDPAGPARELAAVAKTHGRGVSRQLLKLLARLLAILVGALHVVDGRKQLGAACGELSDRLAAFLIAIDNSELGHGVLRS